MLNNRGIETKSDLCTDKSRRQLLKVTAVGGTTVGLEVVPAIWTKPVVNSVNLPAHATTTISCGSATAIDVTPAPDGGNLTDGIDVTFDCVSCEVNAVNDSDAASADSIIFMEVDNPGQAAPNSPADWDADSLGGTNWSVSDFDGNGPGDGNASDDNFESRTYSLIATRISGLCAGQSFRVFLDVEVITIGVSGAGSGSIEVSASIIPI